MKADDLILRFENNSVQQRYENKVNQALGGNLKVSIDSSSGQVSLVPTGNSNVLTSEQQAFVEVYGKAVCSEYDVNMRVLDSNSKFDVGDWTRNIVDITDVESFDNAGPGGGTSAGAIAHETAEQTSKAEKGLKPGEQGAIGTDSNGKSVRLDFQDSHKKAGIPAEDKVNGNTRVDNHTYDLFNEKDGSKTRQDYNYDAKGNLNVTKTHIP